MSLIEQDDDRARKERSPSFPFISLPKALERAEAFADAHKRSPTRLQALGQTWGYAPSSSGLQQTIAALKAYGLLDDLGRGEARKVQLSELAWRILQDTRPGARDDSLRDAALRPRLFAEMAEMWVAHDRPSDSHCISELTLDRGFTQAAAQVFLKVFDETMSYAGLTQADKLSPPSHVETGIMPTALVAHIPPAPAAKGIAAPIQWAPAPQTASAVAPFTMAFGPGRLWGSFDLSSQEQADEMIRAISAMKALLKEKEDAPENGAE
ncbi:hypothetical protein ACMA5K_20470 [Bradyrhizobium diazoefficiens]|uniref:hypothetical protein n=1 Tax=Bradyrhizobium diazoefficiens TaxID=1355477 RepID=UPI0015B75896|nr:hypothetical protein [Bradyrhizobium diazoefficiens]QLD43185.1 hypothetical protein HUW42_20305 [Bradyrhizobium diazoefficiens]